MTVALSHQRKCDFDRFEAHIRKLDEVAECIATGDGMDYVLRIYSPSSTALQKLIEALLAAELGIERYMTCIVTHDAKSAGPDLAGLTTRAGN